MDFARQARAHARMRGILKAATLCLLLISASASVAVVILVARYLQHIW